MQRAFGTDDVGYARALRAVAARDLAGVDLPAACQGENEVPVFIYAGVLYSVDLLFGRLLDFGHSGYGEHRRMHGIGRRAVPELSAHHLRVYVEREFQFVELLQRPYVFQHHVDVRDVAHLLIVAAALGVGRVYEVVLGRQLVGYPVGHKLTFGVVIAYGAVFYLALARGACAVRIDERVALNGVYHHFALVGVYAEQIAPVAEVGYGAALIQPFAELHAAHGVYVGAQRGVESVRRARRLLVGFRRIEGHVLGHRIARERPRFGRAAFVPVIPLRDGVAERVGVFGQGGLLPLLHLLRAVHIPAFGRKRHGVRPLLGHGGLAVPRAVRAARAALSALIAGGESERRAERYRGAERAECDLAQSLLCCRHLIYISFYI